jgi:hypothetical protein
MDEPAITFTTISPIVKSLKLRVFKLHHETPLELTQANVTSIVKAWGPSIEILELNPSPVDTRDTMYGGERHIPELTLAALLPIAKHCEVIREFGLYIDATQPQKTPPSTVQFPPTLWHLDFGYSMIKERMHVVEFLGGLMNPNIASDSLSIHGDDPDSLYFENDNGDREPEFYNLEEAWKMVEGILNWRDKRVEKLRKEVERLQRRNEALEKELKRFRKE